MLFLFALTCICMFISCCLLATWHHAETLIRSHCMITNIRHSRECVLCLFVHVKYDITRAINWRSWWNIWIWIWNMKVIQCWSWKVFKVTPVYSNCIFNARPMGGQNDPLHFSFQSWLKKRRGISTSNFIFLHEFHTPWPKEFCKYLIGRPLMT